MQVEQLPSIKMPEGAKPWIIGDNFALIVWRTRTQEDWELAAQLWSAQIMGLA